ncbi:MAG TPA: DUF4142 domain-containing protein [Bryobacteraceae bacterium]|nr:DUF4142 domain-containing protein [Bryobacteraceae bacterium]
MRFTGQNGTGLAAALCGMGLFIGLGGSLLAQKGVNADTPGSSDSRFAREAAMGGMMEVEMGKVAVQKASSEKVKQFGQRMVDDHSKAGDELKGIASKDNITLPTELDPRHRAMVNRYSNMSGTAFDRAYMRDMVKDHQSDIADFEKEANNGTSSDLKNWANSTLPTLRDHLRMAKETDTSLGVTSKR